jgi:acyl-CoA dehydrogenase
VRRFPDEYFRKIDESAPTRSLRQCADEAGWLAALIPQEYGGSGLGLTEASVIMEEINRCGGNSGACHGQMYNMGTLLRHGSRRRRRSTCPRSPAANGACSPWA